MSDKYKVFFSLGFWVGVPCRSEEVDLCKKSGKTEAELDALSDKELEEVIDKAWKNWEGNLKEKVSHDS
jgi:hypothetical protein